MRKFLSLLSVLVLCSALTYAQTKTIVGRVVDAQGQPVPFATVRIKGSKSGVSADADGKFEIKASPTTTLVITGAGIQAKEVLVGTDNVLVAQVSRQSTLDEVVVTALGVRRSRNTLPYAAQQISGDEITKTVTTNVVDNLSGKIAGLEITSSNAMGGSSNVILRGFRSLTQNNQALFIVDGVPYDATSTTGSGYDFGSVLSDLNPDDIASMSVLKGAAASALYGSRGSNGVILVTTKRGSNRKSLGITASFGVSVAAPDPSTLPTYQLQYGEGYDATTNGFYYLNLPWSNAPGTPITPTNDDAATGPLFNKNLQVYNWDAFSPTDPNFHKSTAWQPAQHHQPTDYFVTPITATENVLITGGSEQGTYKFSYTRDDQKGYLPNSMNSKNLFDLLATYNITNKITLETGLNYANESAINRYLYAYTATTNPMTDFRQWWPSNVNIHSLKHDYFNSTSNATWNWLPDSSIYAGNTKGSIGLPAYHDNEYWSQYQNPEKDSRNRYTGHVKLNIALTDYLTLSGAVTEDYYGWLIEQRAEIGSVEPSFYSRYYSTFNETNYNVLLNFNKNVGSNFNIKALLGGNIEDDNLTSEFNTTLGGLILPGYWSISNSVNTPGAPSESLQRKEINSVFGGLTLSWKDMITLDGTLRRDQSSTLPSNNNTYYYPSVSGTFVFSKLLPQTTNWLSFGKVWANYAEVGGDAPYYSVYDTYTLNTPYNGNPLENGSPNHQNQNLLPEENKTYEAGLEMDFLNNRLGFNATYYHSVQSKEILPINVSTSTGFNTFYVNGGSVENQGVELTANFAPVRSRDFSWNINVNWTKPKNKVLSLYGNEPSYAITSYQNNIQEVAEVGKPYGVIRGSDYTYINGQRVISAAGTYVDSSNSLSDIGNIQPSWYGGINNSFSYKNFSLSFLIDVHQGGQLYDLDMDYGSFSGLYPRTAGFNDLGNPLRSDPANGGGVILKGISQVTGKANTIRDYEDLTNGFWTFGSGNGQGAEAEKQFIYSASYVKLREVAFTYSIPSKSLTNLHSVKGIDLSLSGRNLWIIHKDVPYADPEQGQANGNGSIGFQNGSYPSMRTLNFILKVKF